MINRASHPIASGWATVALPARAAVVAVLSGLLMSLLFIYRTDYLGHFIAGYGATLFGLTVAVWAFRINDWAIVGLTVAAILAGAATEATVFRLAIFDPIDFFNQSLGASLACCVTMTSRRPGAIPATLALLLAVFCLLAGFRFAFT